MQWVGTGPEPWDCLAIGVARAGAHPGLLDGTGALSCAPNAFERGAGFTGPPNSQIVLLKRDNAGAECWRAHALMRLKQRGVAQTVENGV